MRTVLTLVACAFLLAGVSGGKATTVKIERAPTMFYYSGCADLPEAEKQYCLALEVMGPPACTGSVEERLNCLERRIVFQEYEMNRLRQELARRNTPRIHPLDDQVSRH